VIATGGGRFVHHKRWGRVGEAGQQQQKGALDQARAEKEFSSYFRSKTGNAWDNGASFAPISGKYAMVERSQWGMVECVETGEIFLRASSP
jgi:hypothetical protein